MERKHSINRIEFWIGIIASAVTIAAFVFGGYGNLTAKLASMQASIDDLKTSQQNLTNLVYQIIPVGKTLSTNNN